MPSPSSTGRPPRGAVIFDLDGTLVDTSGDIVAAVNHVRSGLSLAPLDRDAVLGEVGQGAGYLVSRTTGIAAGSGESFDGALNAFRSYYRANQGARSALYPGVRALLEKLGEASFDLHVLSNKPHEAAVREIAIQGIAPLFRSVRGAGSLPALKPDPVGVFEALAQSGVPKSRGAMVGDLAIDIETGHNAEIAAFFVTWGFSAEPVPDLPHEIARHPEELFEGIVRKLG